jgi:hypothetical protein
MAREKVELAEQMDRREAIKRISIIIASAFLTRETVKFFADPFVQTYIQERIIWAGIHEGTKVHTPEQAGIKHRFDVIRIDSFETHAPISGYLIYGKENSNSEVDKPTIFFAPGFPPGITDEEGFYNGAMWSDRVSKVAIINRICDAGFNVVLWAPRGHAPTTSFNKAKGRPGECVSYGYNEPVDCLGVVSKFQELGLSAENTFGFGQSGGCASLIYAAGETSINALYLDSVPAHMQESFEQSYFAIIWFFGYGRTIRHQLVEQGYDPAKINPIDWIRHVSDTRIYIIHNLLDPILSSAQARHYRRLKQRNVSVTIRNSPIVQHQTFRSHDPDEVAGDILRLCRGEDIPDRTKSPIHRYGK